MFTAYALVNVSKKSLVQETNENLLKCIKDFFHLIISFLHFLVRKFIDHAYVWEVHSQRFTFVAVEEKSDFGAKQEQQRLSLGLCSSLNLDKGKLKI